MTSSPFLTHFFFGCPDPELNSVTAWSRIVLQPAPGRRELIMLGGCRWSGATEGACCLWEGPRKHLVNLKEDLEVFKAETPLKSVLGSFHLAWARWEPQEWFGSCWVEGGHTGC